MKNKWGKIITIGVIAFVVGIGLWMGAGIIRSDLVLNFGIVAYRILRGLLIVIAIGGAILTLYGMIREAQAEKRLRALPDAGNLPKEDTKAITPEGIRRAIAKAKILRPKFPFDRCLQQMDRMDDYQARLHTLLATNELEAFRYTEDILAESEMEMCGDIRASLNYLIVLEDDAMAMERYEAMLARSEARFVYIQELLLTLADFVSENMSQGDAADKVRYCNEAIRETFVRDESLTF